MMSSKNEPPAAAPSAISDEPARAAGDGTGTANLDKVRDILFGGQMREVERRFARLEERLLKETSDLKEDVKRRLEALDRYARQESESLSQQIKAEHDARVESDNTLSREIKDGTQTFEKRTSALDEQFSRGERELRQQMLDQHQQLRDEMRQKIDDVLAALARESHELRNDKTDRSTLASLLTEMAMRLNNEFTIPGPEGLENG